MVRVHHLEPLLPRAESARMLLVSVAEVLAGVALFAAADAYPMPFLAEHTLKMVALYLACLHGGMRAIAAAVWLGGQRARDPSVHPILAVTPADFWRRHNRIVGQALYENVFLRVGGLRHPVRGTLAAFAVNGLLHEYLATAMVGRVLGYQLAFFALHGVAVVATMRARPRGAMAGLGRASTLGFNLATGILFALSLDPVMGLYR